jgi:hypothetical protein
MARAMNFNFKGKAYSASPEKIDRKKLYGWTETLALDNNGNECRLVNMDDSGTVIIPPKGTATANMSQDGKWVEKSDLTAVNPDGSPATLVESSYSTPIELTQKATVEDYLSHSISAFYELEGISEEFIKELGEDIYSFDYAYNASYDTQKAFLIENEGKVFMLIGAPTQFEMIALAELSDIDPEDDGEAQEEEFDFGSMF